MPQHELYAGLRYAAALNKLAQLETALRDQVRSQLTQAAYGASLAPLSLHLPRAAELDALRDAIGSAHGDLFVTGAPSAGKSALAVAVIDRLRDRGRHVVALHAAAISGLGTATDPFAGKLADILAVAGSGKPRILIIDGAESALDQLRNLTSAAHAADYQCVIVARDDVVDDVNGVLTSLENPSETPPTAPISYSVGTLSTDEIDTVVNHFPLLATIATRSGAVGLIARPGLIDAVLRSGPPTGPPGQALTELDVFTRYWSRLVEVPRPGASARGRADSAITFARDILAGPVVATIQILEPGAIDSLRLDGILTSASPLVARDQFATDLDLEFATARCLIVGGLDQLRTSPRPRRAMRATRLAIQAQLTPGAVSATLADIRLTLDAIGADHGVRWTELADEALLGHPAAYAIVTELWSSLSVTKLVSPVQFDDDRTTAVETDPERRRSRVDHDPVRDALDNDGEASRQRFEQPGRPPVGVQLVDRTQLGVADLVTHAVRADRDDLGWLEPVHDVGRVRHQQPLVRRVGEHVGYRSLA